VPPSAPKPRRYSRNLLMCGISFSAHVIAEAIPPRAARILTFATATARCGSASMGSCTTRCDWWNCSPRTE
jgi:hypothetical protein